MRRATWRWPLGLLFALPLMLIAMPLFLRSIGLLALYLMLIAIFLIPAFGVSMFYRVAIARKPRWSKLKRLAATVLYSAGFFVCWVAAGVLMIALGYL
ncbi:MAG: hypothetical protein AAGB51_08135 [Planctomycetota bacterium]